MARKWTEQVKPFPCLKTQKPYKTCVRQITKVGKAAEIQLEFMEAPQKGRTMTIQLSLPIRPEGITASFFKACGLDTSPQSTIVPQDTLGSLITVTFEKDPHDEIPYPNNFKSISQGD
ncbi:hypothetical protein ACFL6U_23380 [Planctomycetota bacterium]